ncbi:MAG: hypothetical protein AAB948_02095, partial [Patescibacteria group bacterium]
TTKDANGFLGQTITGAANGTLTATADASTPDSAIVDDSGTVTTAAFKFAAVNDSFTITDMTVTLADASAVNTVTLMDSGVAVTGGSKPGAATLTFSGLNIAVQSNSTKIITVQLTMSPVGVGAGTAGSSLLTTLTSFTSRTSNGTSDVSANDAGPSIENDPAGNIMYVYRSIPTITNVLYLPNSILAAGTQTVSKFTVSSGGTGAISWQKLVFTVARSIGGTDTLATTQLWNSDTNTQISGTVAYTGSVEADNGTAGTIIFVANSEQAISGAKTYELRTTIAGTVGTGDYISVKIAQPSTFAASVAAFASHTASSASYADVNAGGTVNANDIRLTAQTSVESGYVQTTTEGVATFLTSDTTDEVQSYGTITTGQTIILTESGNTAIGAITGTLVSTGLFTCTAYDAANGGGTATTTSAAILSIKCTKTGAQVILNTAAVAEGVANADVTTITLTTTAGGLAANTVVAAADSDLGFTLVAGVVGDASFVWSDQNKAAHSSTTTDWTNGVLVKNLPTSTQTLSK